MAFMGPGEFDVADEQSANVAPDLGAESLLDGAVGFVGEEKVRDEVVERAFRSLSADAQRCDGVLKRNDINRIYFKRSLSVNECISVERLLIAAGYEIQDEENQEGDQKEASRTGSKFLSESEERSLGRQIQLFLRLPKDRSDLNREYVDRATKAADDARRKFVESNLLYVEKIVRSIAPRTHITMDDIRQEGLLGLFHATDRYDPEMGFRFKTYATWWIQQFIRRSIANNERTIRLPIHVQEKEKKIRRARRKLLQLLRRQPSLGEVAKYLGDDPEKLIKLMWRVQVTSCIDGDEPVEDDVSILSLVPDASLSPCDRILNNEVHEKIVSALGGLSPREAVILRLRFGVGTEEEHTLEEIGRQFNLTRERIRQIEGKALEKLKKMGVGDILRELWEP